MRGRREALGLFFAFQLFSCGSPLVNSILVSKATAPTMWLSLGSGDQFFLFLPFIYLFFIYISMDSGILILFTGVIICYYHVFSSKIVSLGYRRSFKLALMSS